MSFSKIGWYCAAIIVFFSLMQILMGLGALFGADDATSRDAFANRYLGSRTLGQGIDRGFYGLVIGTALGILANIGETLKEILELLSSDRS